MRLNGVNEMHKVAVMLFISRLPIASITSVYEAGSSSTKVEIPFNESIKIEVIADFGEK